VRQSIKIRDLENTAEEAERPKRTTRTATRATPNDEKTDRPNEKRSNGGHDGRAMLQKVVELLGELRTEVNELRQEVMDQREVIEGQQDTIRDLGRQLEDTKKQMGEELRKGREQLEAIATRVTEPRPLSYVEVAQTLSASQVDTVISNSVQRTTTPRVTEILHCTFDTSSTEDERAEEITPGAIRTLEEGEVRAEKAQPDWRCLAVIKDPKKPRIRIACRNEEENKTIKRLVEVKLPRGTRMLRDDLHPIKVDHVSRTAVLDETNNIRDGAAEAIGRENEVQIAKIGWLSDRYTYKAHGSMVIYLARASDARRLLTDRYAYAGGESGKTSIFEHRDRPEQCYNCQRIGDGHRAYQCNNPQVCANCAKEGHRHRDCHETIAKFVPCGGPHPSFSRNCRKLYPSLHE
jgi:hypothetical protein